jgi:tetratricopeptide (TPR) repeat protein
MKVKAYNLNSKMDRLSHKGRVHNSIVAHAVPLFVYYLLVFLASSSALLGTGLAFASEQQDKSPQSTSHPTESYSITTAKNKESERSKTELQRLIKQIRSYKFEINSPTLESGKTIEPALTNEPNSRQTSLSSMDNASGSVKTKDLGDGSSTLESHPQAFDKLMRDATFEAVTLSYQPVSEQTLEMLENLAQSDTATDQLRNPLQLAEILFLSGHHKQAAIFYQHALSRRDPNDVTPAKGGFWAWPSLTGDPVHGLALAQDRAWILFQIGNCLREDDVHKARQMYRQLIKEYPNCPWADLAKNREFLIDWFLVDKPRELIEECRNSGLVN